MVPRKEEKKDRFRFDKLEDRIAPSGHACFGLLNAIAHLDTAAAHVPPGQAQHVVDTVSAHNPHAADFCGL